MKKRLLGFPLFTAALLAVAACVTINVYFPEKAIEDLSQQIEEEVQKKAAEIDEGQAPPEEPGKEPARGGCRAGNSGLFDSLLGISPATPPTCRRPRCPIRPSARSSTPAPPGPAGSPSSRPWA